MEISYLKYKWSVWLPCVCESDSNFNSPITLPVFVDKVVFRFFLIHWENHVLFILFPLFYFSFLWSIRESLKLFYFLSASSITVLHFLTCPGYMCLAWQILSEWGSSVHGELGDRKAESFCQLAGSWETIAVVYLFLFPGHHCLSDWVDSQNHADFHHHIADLSTFCSFF